jgi:hypothetical protein
MDKNYVSLNNLIKELFELDERISKAKEYLQYQEEDLVKLQVDNKIYDWAEALIIQDRKCTINETKAGIKSLQNNKYECEISIMKIIPVVGLKIKIQHTDKEFNYSIKLDLVDGKRVRFLLLKELDVFYSSMETESDNEFSFMQRNENSNKINLS